MECHRTVLTSSLTARLEFYGIFFFLLFRRIRFRSPSTCCMYRSRLFVHVNRDCDSNRARAHQAVLAYRVESVDDL